MQSTECENENLTYIKPRRGRPPVLYSDRLGESKGLNEWFRDPRCRCSYQTLWTRLKNGWRVDDAMSVCGRPPVINPGDVICHATVISFPCDVNGFADLMCHCGVNFQLKRKALLSARRYKSKSTHAITCGCKTKPEHILSSIKQRTRKVHRNWVESNKSKRRAYMANWRRNNRVSINLSSLNRSLAKKGTAVKACWRLKAIYRIARSSYAVDCYICGKTTYSKSERQVDHVVPLAKGGTHTIDNVRIACKHCNLSKRDMPLEEFIALNGN